MLYIEHLTKTFGEKKAVDDLSLHIAAHLVSAVDGAACNAANRSRTAAICPQVIFPSGHPP